MKEKNNELQFLKNLKDNPDFKNYMGKVAYYITGIEQALHLRDFNIKEVDLGRIDGTYFMNVLAGGLLSVRFHHHSSPRSYGNPGLRSDSLYQ